ncbi:MAG TPA: peptidyl-prolyl cis-trans isomerase [Verrucomicrobiae bacterium]|nr:peptidyl-prolyl cis-trans isomerase [Verrucomicrobiae bacterium]
MRTNLMKLFRLILIVMTACCAGLPLRAELADGVKAVVNDTAITYSQVEEFTMPVMETLQRQYAGQPAVLRQKYDETLRDSLEQLVERQLILHAFDVEGYHLPDNFADQLVQDRIRDRFGNRTALMKTLQAQGGTIEQFRKELLEQYIVQALRSKNVSQEVVISPYKVENYYLNHQDNFKIEDQIKLRMIVLDKTSADDTNAVSLAREIEGKIKEGATFEEMASLYSQGSQQHAGGDWGWIERSVLSKELADAAFALKPGQISDPVVTPESVYLMLVEQVRPSHVKPLGEVRGDIEKTIRVQEQARLEKQWIDGLKKKTFIRYF